MRVVLAVGLFGAIAIGAQAPPASVRLTATTQNVSGAGEAIKITISNWSTDTQKDEMIAAWTRTNVSAAPAAEGRGARGGRGAGADAAGVAGVVPRRPLREPMHRDLKFHRTRMLLIRIVPPFDSVAAARAAAVATLLRLRPRLLWLRL